MLGDRDWLGIPKKLKWQMDKNEGLVVEIPERLQKEENQPCRQAYVFKIEQLLDKKQ